ncbi:MAG TPA: pyridoxal phosphate-dependent aminotransferase [Chloroflexota bacterium]|nr:pyridoxal phosphate-dependent aminotransferase [Chloroflexota bacterium]
MARLPRTGAGTAAWRPAARLRDLPPVGSRELAERIAAARGRGTDVLELSPYPVRALPPHVVAAAERAIAENREAPSRGLSWLRRAAAEQVGREIGRSIDPETEVLVTNGAMQALNLVCRTLLEPGDEVLIAAPCYFFHGCVRLAGGVAVHVPMAEADGFAWDVPSLDAAVTPRTRALVVSTPVNPTGRVLTRAELIALAELALSRDLLVIADESYDRLVFDGWRHESIAALPGMAERTVLIKSCTKSYAMPAWRVGYVVAPPPLTGALTKALEWEQLHTGHVAQAAAAAAIGGPQDWLADVGAEFQAARDRLLTGLAGLDGFSCVPPRGGPFLFLNVSRLFASSEEASQALLEAGVPTTPGWYCQSDAHVRLAIGAPPPVLDEVVARLTEVARRRRMAAEGKEVRRRTATIGKAGRTE